MKCSMYILLIVACSLRAADDSKERLIDARPMQATSEYGRPRALSSDNDVRNLIAAEQKFDAALQALNIHVKKKKSVKTMRLVLELQSATLEWKSQQSQQHKKMLVKQVSAERLGRKRLLQKCATMRIATSSDSMSTSSPLLPPPLPFFTSGDDISEYDGLPLPPPPQ